MNWKQLGSPPHEELRRLLIERRQKGWLTQQQVADRLGWGQKTVSKFPAICKITCETRQLPWCLPCPAPCPCDPGNLPQITAAQHKTGRESPDRGRIREISLQIFPAGREAP